jgi:hypothetical protein
LSFSFPFSFHLKNVVFGRSLVQLILAALSLYPFGVKEGGLFRAPWALDSRFLGLPGLDYAVLAPSGLDPGVVGLLGPGAFLPAPAPGKFFAMQGFVFALCAFGPKETNERTNKKRNERTNTRINKRTNNQARRQASTQRNKEAINRSINQPINQSNNQPMDIFQRVHH